MPVKNPTKFGECLCGCGGKTSLYERTRPSHGSVKGRPKRFLPGHAAIHASACAAERLTGYRPTVKLGANTNSLPGYTVWANMHQRCSNKKLPQFCDYGGRGITVCERWRSFENFISDMGPPAKGMTIERKNNDLGYSKNNCVWADRFQQAANTRKNVRLTLNGRTLHVLAWARELNVSPYTLFYRVNKGLSPERVLDVTGLKRANGDAPCSGRREP